jgi:hypothetical protein
MPGGGSIAGMILALKNNALLIRKRKSLKDISGKYPGKPRHIELEFPNASPEELKEFHEQVLKQKRRSTVIQVSLALLFLLVAVALVVLFVGFMT